LGDESLHYFSIPCCPTVFETQHIGRSGEIHGNISSDRNQQKGEEIMTRLPVRLFVFVFFAAIAVPVASRTEAGTVSDSYHLFSAVPVTTSTPYSHINDPFEYEGPLALDLCYSSIDSAVISSNPEGTGQIAIDNYISVNSQLPCGDSCDPQAPVDVKGILVNGTNTFSLWDWGFVYQNTELYLVVSGTPCNQDPVCTNATPSNGLWPPQHKMVSVGVLGVTDPDGDPVTITIDSVYQDEVLNGQGDGDTAPDAVINGGTVDLRAERDGTANGRVYYINFTASDGKGGTCSGTVEVGVNHDLGKKGEAIGEGPLYNSTQTQKSVAPSSSGNAHNNSGNNPGNSGNAHNNSGNNPGNSGNAHNNNGNNPGNSGNNPGNSGNNPGNSGNNLGNSGNAHDNSGNNPGHGGNPPGQDKNQDKGKNNEEHGKKQ
jgi:hypothetical protein